MLTRILALVATALLLAGCSTEEGVRAQELLQAAEVAQQGLTSAAFEGSVSFDFSGQRMALRFSGATAPEGEYVSMHATGSPAAEAFSMQMLVKGERAWMDVGGGWQPMPAPERLGSKGLGADAFQQLARHVKAVRVTEGQIVDGKSVTTIGGEIDTQGMLDAVTKLGSVAGELQGVSIDPAQLGVEFGDIEAVLTIDETTRLLTTAFVSFPVKAKGQEVSVEIRYRLTGANEPVRLPSP